MEEKAKEIRSELKKLPAGKLTCAGNGKYFKWYHSDGKTRTYIPKSQQALAEKLSLKQYLTLQLEDVLHEKLALESYLRKHNSYIEQSTQLLSP